MLAQNDKRHAADSQRSLAHMDHEQRRRTLQKLPI